MLAMDVIFGMIMIVGVGMIVPVIAVRVIGMCMGMIVMMMYVPMIRRG